MEEIIKVENLCFEYEPGLQTINNISFIILYTFYMFQKYFLSR